MIKRKLGTTDIEVTPVAMGCWPIAGMSSVGVNDADSLKTLRSAIESGINFLDTAYCYGPGGESEALIARALAKDRDSIVVATKCGIHWDRDGQRVFDASPAAIRRECDESLRRLRTDRVELLYLHAPDPKIPLADSAEAFQQLMAEGKTRSVGLSNVDVPQIQQFREVCPVVAVQPHYNMLQREIEVDLLPWCVANDISIIVYWPLLKGLLAGKLTSGHVFQQGDGRAKYPMFQGEQWRKNLEFVDELRVIADDLGRSVSQLVVNWTIHQPGITSALCGAKRAYQIRETAGAMDWKLDPESLARIDKAIERRGHAVSTGAI